MDTALAALRRAIQSKACAYPQKNVSSYFIRRIKDKLSKDKLEQMPANEKEALVKDLQGELEQMTRMVSQAKSVDAAASYDTVLQRVDFKDAKKNE